LFLEARRKGDGWREENEAYYGGGHLAQVTWKAGGTKTKVFWAGGGV